MGDDGLPLHEVIEDPTPARLAEEHDEEQVRKRLHAAIAALPEIERVVVTHRLNGVRGIDIAQMFDMSPANVFAYPQSRNQTVASGIGCRGIIMKDRSYFIEAALRYEELLESGQIISLDAFVAQEPPEVREELRAFSRV